MHGIVCGTRMIIRLASVYHALDPFFYENESTKGKAFESSLRTLRVQSMFKNEKTNRTVKTLLLN
jgi:hypothetical protein